NDDDVESRARSARPRGARAHRPRRHARHARACADEYHLGVAAWWRAPGRHRARRRLATPAVLDEGRAPRRRPLRPAVRRRLRATVLTAIATYPLRLIEVAREEKVDLGALALRVGIFGSEMWSDDLRARIDRELGIRSHDIIGMTETGGPGLGIDCEARAGIHVWEDHYHVEIVDPRTGRVVADGAE